MYVLGFSQDRVAILQYSSLLVRQFGQAPKVDEHRLAANFVWRNSRVRR